MKRLQKLLSIVLIMGTCLFSEVLSVPRQRRSGQAASAGRKPATQSEIGKKTKKKATERYIDQHTANRFTRVANYLLSSKSPEDRAKIAAHVRALAAVLEEQDPETARNKLKKVEPLPHTSKKTSGKKTTTPAAKAAGKATAA